LCLNGPAEGMTYAIPGTPGRSAPDGRCGAGLAAIGAALRLRKRKIEAHPHVDARLADVITAMLPNFVLLVLCVSFEMEVAVPLKWKLWCHENREAICLANHIWISRRGKSLSAR
jgi:hypothetical protein